MTTYYVLKNDNDEFIHCEQGCYPYLAPWILGAMHFSSVGEAKTVCKDEYTLRASPNSNVSVYEIILKKVEE